MIQYTDKTLTEVWNLVKAGARKSHIMALYNCSDKEAIDVYDQAQQKFGRGPRKEKKQVIKRDEEPVATKPAGRPAAVYSAGYLNTLNKYEN